MVAMASFNEGERSEDTGGANGTFFQRGSGRDARGRKKKKKGPTRLRKKEEKKDMHGCL